MNRRKFICSLAMVPVAVVGITVGVKVANMPTVTPARISPGIYAYQQHMVRLIQKQHRIVTLYGSGPREFSLADYTERNNFWRKV